MKIQFEVGDKVNLEDDPLYVFVVVSIRATYIEVVNEDGGPTILHPRKRLIPTKETWQDAKFI